MKRVYLAGKIDGDKNYKEKFRKITEELTAQGLVVLNPAVLPDGLVRHEYMQICLPMLLSADYAIFLPDWKESAGAVIEYELCRYINMDRVIMNDDGTLCGE